MWSNRWLIALSLVIIEIALLVLLCPENKVKYSINEERVENVEFFGKEKALEIYANAKFMFTHLMIKSGVQHKMYSLLIPTKQQKEASIGVEELGSREGWFPWIETRLNTLCGITFIVLVRICTFIILSPYMLILLIPCTLGGIIERKIKRSNFAYASPALTKLIFEVFTYTFLGAVLLIFIPLPANPRLCFYVLVAMCVVLSLALGNVQKRL